jgi:hypothetical protein
VLLVFVLMLLLLLLLLLFLQTSSEDSAALIPFWLHLQPKRGFFDALVAATLAARVRVGGSSVLSRGNNRLGEAGDGGLVFANTSISRCLLGVQHAL